MPPLMFQLCLRLSLCPYVFTFVCAFGSFLFPRDTNSGTYVYACTCVSSFPRNANSFASGYPCVYSFTLDANSFAAGVLVFICFHLTQTLAIALMFSL